MPEETSYQDALYNVKRNFLIVGLTGYTGSGCSECRKVFEQDEKPIFPSAYSVIKGKYSNLDRSMQRCCEERNRTKSERDLRIFNKLERTWNETTWHKFISVEVSVIIFCFVVYKAFTSIKTNKILNKVKETPSFPEANDIIPYLELLWKGEFKKDLSNLNNIIEAYCKVKKIYKEFVNSCENNWSLTKLMQNFGDQVRRYGTISPVEKTSLDRKNLFVVPEAVRRLIKCYYWLQKEEGKGPHHFVIDAFRNPLEVEYFKWRYSEFYLIGILRDEKDRKDTLQLSTKMFSSLNKRENGKLFKKTKQKIHKWIASQDIYSCLQKADYYIENVYDKSRSFVMLRFNVIKLLALAKNPGCVPPTQDERNMQIAMSAKQMSGCISRQVGAVIVNRNGYVIGIGWNDPPSGQTPCSLRTGYELANEASECVFSNYERSEEFVKHIKNGFNIQKPFCFRSELSLMEKKDKRSEFTRALHAEENAFLQALKASNGSLDGAVLYTTSCTCTLCAKKAYHLGVSRIVFIEEYTDIAIDQTLLTGDRVIDIERFQGVTGSAYFRLFSSLIPEKDIIQLYN